MKNFIEQLKKQAEGISLRSDERQVLRERLTAYMEYHPLPENQSFAKHRTWTQRLHLELFSRHGQAIGRVTAGLAVFLLVVIPVAAEKALPGDVLYPVKVRFNEELRGALNSSSPYQQIEWETERLERRIAEAKLLSDAGELTPDAEAEVARAIKMHSDAAKASINNIRESDNDEATLAEIVLSSSLEVSAEVLEKENQTIDGATTTSVLVEAVHAAREGVLEQGGNQTPSYNKLLSRLEAETTLAHEYFNSLNGSVSDQGRVDIEERLASVKTKVEKAITLREEDDTAARSLLVEALGSTRKLISFMTNLDVRSNVSIEELVPADPTEEDRLTLIEERLQLATQLETDIEVGLADMSTSSNDYVAVSDSLQRYRENLAIASSSLASGELEEAEEASSAALQLVEEILNTLTALGLIDNLEIDSATSTEETVSE